MDEQIKNGRPHLRLGVIGCGISASSMAAELAARTLAAPRRHPLPVIMASEAQLANADSLNDLVIIQPRPVDAMLERFAREEKARREHGQSLFDRAQAKRERKAAAKAARRQQQAALRQSHVQNP